MSTNCISIILVAMLATASANPATRRPTEAVTDGRLPKVSTETTMSPNNNAATEKKLQRTKDSHIGYFGCNDDTQCINGGHCVTVGEEGNICNCTEGFVGPFCGYQAPAVRIVVNTHSRFKISFLECMKKSGTPSNSKSVAILKKCSKKRNMCWLEDGGVEALKCFFWGLSNSVRLSLTEEKRNGESRKQMLSYLEKFGLQRPRENPSGESQTLRHEVAVASIQININNIPSLEDKTMNRQTKPIATTKPRLVHSTSQYENEGGGSVSEEPVIIDQRSDSSTIVSSQSPSTVITKTVNATTPSTTGLSAIEAGGTTTSADVAESDYSPYDDYTDPYIYSFVGNDNILNDTFLGNVVEANLEYDADMFDMVPFVNTSSNMRQG